MSGPDGPPPDLREQATEVMGEMLNLIGVSFTEGYKQACSHITTALRSAQQSIADNYALDGQIRAACVFVLDDLAKNIDLVALWAEAPEHPNHPKD